MEETEETVPVDTLDDTDDTILPGDPPRRNLADICEAVCCTHWIKVLSMNAPFDNHNDINDINNLRNSVTAYVDCYVNKRTDWVAAGGKFDGSDFYKAALYCRFYAVVLSRIHTFSKKRVSCSELRLFEEMMHPAHGQPIRGPLSIVSCFAWLMLAWKHGLEGHSDNELRAAIKNRLKFAKARIRDYKCLVADRTYYCKAEYAETYQPTAFSDLLRAFDALLLSPQDGRKARSVLYCDMCGATFLSQVDFCNMTCGRCWKAHYCGKECQLRAWTTHRPHCAKYSFDLMVDEQEAAVYPRDMTHGQREGFQS